ncbi:hypothetical protein [Chryseobacterium sp. MFBS3-17]|uniref:hypothetical protein n=1 Tax=Chryseobacterium sp. MFBS3-17 TaxID=2886689 RepID=UPI001D0E88C2|nr:hypothetical protein [Chryseobacterium sp. MFBS3-17]MCC2590246.1 hypothetical protein [Chryseobacterium sp. MFBS3-17]
MIFFTILNLILFGNSERNGNNSSNDHDQIDTQCHHRSLPYGQIILAAHNSIIPPSHTAREPSPVSAVKMEAETATPMAAPREEAIL